MCAERRACHGEVRVFVEGAWVSGSRVCLRKVCVRACVRARTRVCARACVDGVSVLKA